MPLVVEPPSSAARSLGLRMRGDLEFRLQFLGGRRYWAVKDPVALKYFHLRDEEYAVLTMLDGRVSLEEVRERLEQAFAPRLISPQQVHGFLAELHQNGLVLSASAGQGEQLLIRRDDQSRRRRLQAFLGLLAIRFRGVSPRRLLDFLVPKFGWLFSPACVVAAALLAMAAALLVLVEFDQFRARLPEFRTILSAANLPWLVLAIAVTKVLHELGHALACRRSGSDCHEIGVMLLVFTPCLYCNVSDSWMLPSKWRRMAIAAAGMYVELILAASCTFLWWFSAPGIFNSLCMNTMLVCSVGTLLLNGNPLLRFDGYYILSDWLEVPNLSTQSSTALRRVLARWCLGIDIGSERELPTRRAGLLASYAVASIVYRVMIIIAVLWALGELARPYGLRPLVVLLGGATLAAMVWPPVAAAAHWMGHPAPRRRIAPLRAALSLALLAAAAIAALFFPVPMRVAAPVVVEFRDAQRVYVNVPGTLTWNVPIGAKIEKGAPIARLANSKVELEIARLTAERDTQRLFLANLEARRLQGVADGAEVPAAKAALADLEERLAQYQHDAERLTILASLGGTLLPPPELPPKPQSADTLERWTLTPLEARNLGTWFDSGTLLCLVGDPTRFEAVLHVTDSDIELVQTGQPARVMLDNLPGQIFAGTVSEISKLDLQSMPRELAMAHDLPARTDKRGVQHPLDTWYQVRVAFDEQPAHLVARVHGRAKISVAPQSLFAQLARYLKQTFSR